MIRMQLIVSLTRINYTVSGMFTLKLIIRIMILTSVTTLWSQESNKFSIGIQDMDYYPYYSFRSGIPEGYFFELMDAFSERYGYDFQYRPLPVSRLYNEFFNGDIDFKFPDDKVWQPSRREAYQIYYSIPLINYTDGVMVLPASRGKGVEQLKYLGIIRGFTPVAFRDLIDSGEVILYENNSLTGLLMQVVQGRLDGVYMDPVIADYNLTDMHLKSRLVFDPELPSADGSYYLSTIKHREIITLFNDFMHEEREYLLEIKKAFELD